MNKFKYKKDVEKIFGYVGSSYKEQKAHGSLSFSIYSDDLTFDNLHKLSTLLKTKDINIHVVGDGTCHGHEPGEYCYCSMNSEIEISCDKIKF